MSEATTVQGVIHGQTVTLNDPVQFADGELVEITIARRSPGLKATVPTGDGLSKSAGAWAEDGEQLDEFLEWNRQRRKVPRSEIAP
jgi:hypothetical protein